MLLAVLAVCSEEELEDSSSDEDDPRGAGTDLALSPNEIAARRQQIKNKILAVGKMQRVFQLLRCVFLPRRWANTDGRILFYREEAENATELSSTADADPNGAYQRERGLTIAADALGVQGNHIGRGIRNFADA